MRRSRVIDTLLRGGRQLCSHVYQRLNAVAAGSCGIARPVGGRRRLVSAANGFVDTVENPYKQ